MANMQLFDDALRPRSIHRTVLAILMVTYVTLVCILLTNGSARPYDNSTIGWQTTTTQRRSTLNILWSCLTTIFTCCWVVIHPDIAKTPSGFVPWERLKWFALALFAPELVTCVAMAQFLTVHASCRPVIHGGVIKKLSLRQLFYIMMGGYLLEMPLSSEEEGYYTTLRRPEYIKLSVNGAIEIIRAGHVDKLTMTDEDISDKSKADAVSKCIAIIQGLWTVVQVIMRKVQNKPVSPLEFTAVAFVSTSFFTSIFWFNKPLDVKLPTIIKANDTNEILSVIPIETLQGTKPNEFIAEKWFGDGMVPLLDPSRGRPTPTTTTTTTTVQPLSFGLQFSLTLFLSMLFGGIHLLSTPWVFPTELESYLWLVCSAGTMFIPPIVFIGGYSPMMPTPRFKDKESRRYNNTVTMFGVGYYIAARLYLLVEALMCLREMPVGVYETVPWMGVVPHVQ